MTELETLLQRRDKAVPKSVFNVVRSFVDKAENATITDIEGKEWIDFAGGIGVMNVGHSHPKVVQAIKDQAERLTHSCFHIFMYEPYVALAEKLIELSPGAFPKMAALFNSGAEAVENAVKTARLATGRQGVIVSDMGFHGRTLLTMSMTGKVKPYKYRFGPYAPEIYRIPFAYCYRCPLGRTYPDCGVACADKLNDVFINTVAPEHVACLVIEPITGEGGFLTPPPEYFAKFKAICEEHGIVFVADEVQTGFGRTGRMFAMEHWGVEPDLTTCAKSMGGGMPISGLVGRTELMDEPHVGGIGGTYGGNPVCCAAALAVIEAFEEEGLLQRAEELGRTLRARFDAMAERFDAIGEVRGKGPMLALELVRDRKTREPWPELARDLLAHAREQGLILLACGNYGNVIRTLMPVTIDEETLERGLAIMEDGLAKLTKDA